MKKVLTLFCIIILLASCNAAPLSLSEVNSPPNQVQNKINPSLTLQSISNGNGTTYFVFHSNKDVDARFEMEGNKLNLIFKERNGQGGPTKQHVYKLSGKHHHETIEIFINGKSTPLDVITVY